MVNNKTPTRYDLEERTAKFGENVINFCKRIEQNVITRPIISQLIRSAASVGANYLEANGASSKKDFSNKIYICKKESQESRHWLRMIKSATNCDEQKIDKLQQESKELSMIFHSINNKMK